MTAENVLTDRSTDVVTWNILVDGEELKDSYTVLSITIRKEINRVARAKIILADGSVAEQDFPASNSGPFLPGAEVEIALGYHSENESVFKGLIVTHGIKIKSGGRPHLEIECRDAAVAMTSLKKSACYNEMKDSDIITEIIERYGLEAEVASTEIELPEIVQYNCTDWDFVLSRADANGHIVFNSDGKVSVGPPDLESEALFPVTYGASLLEFEAKMDARTQHSSVTANSWDFTGQEVVSEDGEAPSFDKTGNVPAGDLARVLNGDGLKLYHGGALESHELAAWAGAKLLKSYLAKIIGRARFQGFSGIQPDAIITLEGVGERFNGEAYVSGVFHQVFRGRWMTDVQLGLHPDWFYQHKEISAPPAAGLAPGIQGLHIGKVVQIEEDPQGGYGRILVSIKWVEQEGGTDAKGVWARLSSVFAGGNRGMIFRPEVDDEVVLGFVNGDPRFPIILGALHSADAEAPVPADADNFEKGIYTLGEMKLAFDDDKKSICIETNKGNSITLSEDEKSVSIKDQNENTVILNGDGITLNSAKDLILKASGDIKMEAVNIDAKADAEVKAQGGAGAEFKSDAIVTIKGSMVMIN